MAGERACQSKNHSMMRLLLSNRFAERRSVESVEGRRVTATIQDISLSGVGVAAAVDVRIPSVVFPCS